MRSWNLSFKWIKTGRKATYKLLQVRTSYFRKKMQRLYRTPKALAGKHMHGNTNVKALPSLKELVLSCDFFNQSALGKHSLEGARR